MAAPGDQADKDKSKDEVRIAVATGGVEAGVQDEGVPIPLVNATFVQKPGEAVMVIAEMDAPISDEARAQGCGAAVGVEETAVPAAADENFLIEIGVEAMGIGHPREVSGLAPPASETTRTLNANLFVHCEGPEDPDSEVIFSVDVTLTIVTLG